MIDGLYTHLSRVTRTELLLLDGNSHRVGEVWSEMIGSVSQYDHGGRGVE